MITRDQIKAGRAILGITQAELAEKSSISLATLNNIERGTQHDPRVSTLSRIQAALEDLGVTFTGSGDSLGIYLKRKPMKN